MHVQAFLLESSRISNDARLVSEETHTLSYRIDVVSETLAAEWALAVRWKQVSLSDPGKIGANQIDSNACGDQSCRLLIISLATKPTGKVAYSRVSSRVARLTYVPLISPKEISPASKDSSSRRSRQTRQVRSWEHCAITQSHYGMRPFSERLR
jgi:hypothetical protein